MRTNGTISAAVKIAKEIATYGIDQVKRMPVETKLRLNPSPLRHRDSLLIRAERVSSSSPAPVNHSSLRHVLFTHEHPRLSSGEGGVPPTPPHDL